MNQDCNNGSRVPQMNGTLPLSGSSALHGGVTHYIKYNGSDSISSAAARPNGTVAAPGEDSEYYELFDTMPVTFLLQLSDDLEVSTNQGGGSSSRTGELVHSSDASRKGETRPGTRLLGNDTWNNIAVKEEKGSPQDDTDHSRLVSSSSDVVNSVSNGSPLSASLSPATDTSGKLSLRKVLKSFDGSDASSAAGSSQPGGVSGDLRSFDANGAAYQAQYDFTKTLANSSSLFSFGRDKGIDVENDVAINGNGTPTGSLPGGGSRKLATIKPTTTPTAIVPATGKSSRKYKEPSLNVSFPSKVGAIELKILRQPEEQHRARYLTEGSRGTVKDQSQQGHPSIQLIGCDQPGIVLQVFVGSDVGKAKAHGFYQAVKVCNKNSTPCSERDIEGTTVIEMQLDPEQDMVANIDCVGILKLRNADVEQRIGLAKSKKKSTYARLVFRVNIPQPDGSLLTLQTASNPILCTQPTGAPEICKKSMSSCSVKGNVDLFIIGKNFMKGTQVIFEQVCKDRVVWSKEADIDQDFFQATHIVCTVPAYGNVDARDPVEVQIVVLSSGRSSEPVSFTYEPLPHVMSMPMEIEPGGGSARTASRVGQVVGGGPNTQQDQSPGTGVKRTYADRSIGSRSDDCAAAPSSSLAVVTDDLGSSNLPPSNPVASFGGFVHQLDSPTTGPFRVATAPLLIIGRDSLAGGNTIPSQLLEGKSEDALATLLSQHTAADSRGQIVQPQQQAADVAVPLLQHQVASVAWPSGVVGVYPVFDSSGIYSSIVTTGTGSEMLRHQREASLAAADEAKHLPNAASTYFVASDVFAPEPATAIPPNISLLSNQSSGVGTVAVGANQAGLSAISVLQQIIQSTEQSSLTSTTAPGEISPTHGVHHANTCNAEDGCVGSGFAPEPVKKRKASIPDGDERLNLLMQIIQDGSSRVGESDMFSVKSGESLDRETMHWSGNANVIGEILSIGNTTVEGVEERMRNDSTVIGSAGSNNRHSIGDSSSGFTFSSGDPPGQGPGFSFSPPGSSLDVLQQISSEDPMLFNFSPDLLQTQQPFISANQAAVLPDHSFVSANQVSDHSFITTNHRSSSSSNRSFMSGNHDDASSFMSGNYNSTSSSTAPFMTDNKSGLLTTSLNFGGLETMRCSPSEMSDGGNDERHEVSGHGHEGEDILDSLTSPIKFEAKLSTQPSPEDSLARSNHPSRHTSRHGSLESSVQPALALFQSSAQAYAEYHQDNPVSTETGLTSPHKHPSADNLECFANSGNIANNGSGDQCGHEHDFVNYNEVTQMSLGVEDGRLFLADLKQQQQQQQLLEHLQQTEQLALQQSVNLSIGSTRLGSPPTVIHMHPHPMQESSLLSAHGHTHLNHEESPLSVHAHSFASGAGTSVGGVGAGNVGSNMKAVENGSMSTNLQQSLSELETLRQKVGSTTVDGSNSSGVAVQSPTSAAAQRAIFGEVDVATTPRSSLTSDGGMFYSSTSRDDSKPSEVFVNNSSAHLDDVKLGLMSTIDNRKMGHALNEFYRSTSAMSHNFDLMSSSDTSVNGLSQGAVTCPQVINIVPAQHSDRNWSNDDLHQLLLASTAQHTTEASLNRTQMQQLPLNQQLLMMQQFQQGQQLLHDHIQQQQQQLMHDQLQQQQQQQLLHEHQQQLLHDRLQQRQQQLLQDQLQQQQQRLLHEQQFSYVASGAGASPTTGEYHQDILNEGLPQQTIAPPYDGSQRRSGSISRSLGNDSQDLYVNSAASGLAAFHEHSGDHNVCTHIDDDAVRDRGGVRNNCSTDQQSTLGSDHILDHNSSSSNADSSLPHLNADDITRCLNNMPNSKSGR